MTHINSFLRETRKTERRLFRESVVAHRAAQLDNQHYAGFMRELAHNERQHREQGQKREFRTYEEQMKLDSQRHLKFNQLSAKEQEKLIAEREALWGQIPEHLQSKARKLAGR